MVVKRVDQILVLFIPKDGADITTAMTLLVTTMLKSTKTIINQKQKHKNKTMSY